MKKKWITLAMLFCLTAGTAWAGASGHWLHVRVQEDGDDGERISVNIPLSLVQAILPAIETDEFRGGRIDLGHGEIEDNLTIRPIRGLSAEVDKTDVWAKTEETVTLLFIKSSKNAKQGDAMTVYEIKDNAEYPEHAVTIAIPGHVIGAEIRVSQPYM